jgi:ADP-heptose:LPS heptosyltransferase
LRSGILSLLSGVETRVGFQKGFSKELNYFFNNHRVIIPNGSVSRFRKNLKLLEAIGLDTRNHGIRLWVSQTDQTYVFGFLKERHLLDSHFLVAINPATSPNTRFKRWFPEEYARLADGLVAEMGATVLFTWGPGELQIVERIASLMKFPSTICCQSSLKQLAEVFRHCHLYIGNDTGPMHIAALMGTPVVAIYGPTHPVENAPYDGTPSIQVRKDIPCSPCRDQNCQRLECLKSIAHEDVLKAVRELLWKTRRTS